MTTAERCFASLVARADHPRGEQQWIRTASKETGSRSRKVKEQWGKLTDDDLDVIDGKQDQVEDRLQQRDGYAKDQAQKEVNAWFDRQKW